MRNAQHNAARRRSEHHVAHLSSAFHVCVFEEEMLISIDVFGDFSSAAWGAART
jgi:carbamoyltransferase